MPKFEKPLTFEEDLAIQVKAAKRIMADKYLRFDFLLGIRIINKQGVIRKPWRAKGLQPPYKFNFGTKEAPIYLTEAEVKAKIKERKSKTKLCTQKEVV
ncbi:hypothetical protein [Chitinophaga skermanii]|nr:hypothetical protein [Chitinophaga skermanii]